MKNLSAPQSKKPPIEMTLGKVERIVKILALKGKFAFVRTSSEAFINRKHFIFICGLAFCKNHILINKIFLCRTHNVDFYLPIHQTHFSQDIFELFLLRSFFTS